MTDTTFLENLLIFILISCTVYYIYNYKINSKNSNSNNIVNMTNNLVNNNDMNNINNTNNINNIIKDDFMPVMSKKRYLGPIINFHQLFNNKLNNCKKRDDNKLGWRNWWDKNKRDGMLVKDTGFEGTVIKNYLNNLDNTNNMFLK